MERFNRVIIDNGKLIGEVMHSEETPRTNEYIHTYAGTYKVNRVVHNYLDKQLEVHVDKII